MRTNTDCLRPVRASTTQPFSLQSKGIMNNLSKSKNHLYATTVQELTLPKVAENIIIIYLFINKWIMTNNTWVTHSYYLLLIYLLINENIRKINNTYMTVQLTGIDNETQGKKAQCWKTGENR